MIQTRLGSPKSPAVRFPLTGSIAWEIRCQMLAIACTVIGLFWDIAWHKSIGRDSFWTPAHVAIYLGAVLGGSSAAASIFPTTFARSQAAEARRRISVRIWGLRGPLGSFVSAWGGIAMLTSAPFDNWWHNAYGLDVKVVSPPHILLLLGIVAVQCGALLSVIHVRASAPSHSRHGLDWLVLYAGGIILTTVTIPIEQYTGNMVLHSAQPYELLSAIVPLTLLGIGSASESKWGCTGLAGIYTFGRLAQLWILPMFAAEPKLGPVFHRVTHFIPGPFPLLLLAAALVLDILRARLVAPHRRWREAAILGPAFLAALVVVQWPFASLLMLPAARNWFFGTHYFPYFSAWPDPEWPFRFHPIENSLSEFCAGMALALCLAILSVRIGMAIGGRLARLRR
jgi:hypothetical protein